MLEGVGAVRPPGVHHRRGVGQLVLALVVVGDHKVHADLPGVAGLLHAGDAAVHGDDQRHALVPQAPQGVPAQAVAVLDPPGDVLQAVRPPGAEVVHHKHGGGDAVHVVIAEYRHPLPGGQGPADALHRPVHVPHEQGGPEQPLLPLQEGGGLLRGGDAPGGQHGGEEGGIPRLPQPPGPGLVVFSAVPAGVAHGDLLLSWAGSAVPGASGAQFTKITLLL